MRIGQIIKNYRDDHGLSVRAFAQLCGISPSYVSKLETDVENKLSLTLPKIGQIANGLGLTPDELLGIMDNTSVELDSSSLKKSIPFMSVPDMSFIKKIPVLGSTACGSPIPAIREYDYIEIDDAIKADFALVAEGKSMTGCGIMDGSLVFFKKTDFVENGEIAAITVGDSTTIKKFYKYGDTVVLRPCNPEFPDLSYEGENLGSIHVFGAVVACLTNFK